MKKLSRKEMKNVNGGKPAPGTNGCCRYVSTTGCGILQIQCIHPPFSDECAFSGPYACI